jgi:hypothetical protein
MWCFEVILLESVVVMLLKVLMGAEAGVVVAKIG